tara:strand:- start:539 stop:784 length:246 start_codon:yes stop_codon:yes gene_type:complete
MAFDHMKLYTDGVWQGREDRVITINGVEHNLDEYAKENGIELPDSKGYKKPKKEINTTTDIKEESYGDMEHKDDEGDTSVD